MLRAISLRRSTVNVIAVAIVVVGPELGAQARAPSFRGAADRIIAAALADSSAYERIATLVDRFGHRLSGSAALERAIDWILGEMRRDGLENVRGEPVMVPRWVRGAESATLVSPRRMELHMLGLGGSVGTPPAGITAPVLAVSSFDELTRRAAEARGKIVLFDVPFTTYGETVRYRVAGAVAAARVGAVAALIRSIATFSLQSPHTGSMGYDAAVPRIPAAALSVEDAAMLHRMSDRGERVVVTGQASLRTNSKVSVVGGGE
jgi:carboxypeptidase Q